MTLYKDGPQTSVELIINAPISEVWAMVSDPKLPAEFSHELVSADWGTHPTGRPGKGSTIVGHSHNELVGDWTSTSIVTHWEPEATFEWAVREIENSASKWAFDLESVEGGTLLRQRYLIGPGTSGVLRIIAKDPDNEELIIATRLKNQEASMMGTLEAVKAKLES